MSDRKLLLIGAGGFAREVHGLVIDAGLEPNFAGFIEEYAAHGRTVHDHPVYDVQTVRTWKPDDVLLCAAIGSPARRRLVDELEGLGFAFTTLQHPSAQLGPNAEVGVGCVVTAHVKLTADVRVGQHVLLNIGCVVAHDVLVGDFSTISPTVNLNGGVHVGEGVFIGTGATVIPGVRVGDGAVIAAGACVVRDVEPGTAVAGVPARELRAKPDA